MSNSSDSSSDGKSLENGKVFQVGFNISLPGKPGANFDIVFNEKGEAITQLTPSSSTSVQALPSTSQVVDLGDSSQSCSERSKSSAQRSLFQEPKHVKKLSGAIPKQARHSQTGRIDSTVKAFEMDKSKNSPGKDRTIIDEIKNAMGNFERFSEHLKEIPRFSNRSLITSTPFADRSDSRSEGNLTSFEDRSRRSTPRYDYIGRKDYYRTSVKPSQGDLFLKPLPAEDYFKKGMVNRYFDLEPYRHYGSEGSLTKYSDYSHRHTSSHKSRSDSERYDGLSSGSECYSTDTGARDHPPGILKKTEVDNADKQSSSSADSVKDIKIYQSGGILIMQNFNENLDLIEKNNISDISAKLIENCNKLKEEIQSNIQSSDECQKPLISNSSDEVKGKTVQFDLSASENFRKSADALSDDTRTNFSTSKNGSPESKNDYTRSKDTFSYATAQSQDFPSLSTQENDSIASTAHGMSPTSSTSGKKLEWDSGADVGYLNLDLSKENLSTIERIILRGLSNDGKSEKKVIYEKRPEKPEPRSNRSKFILERMPSELVIEEVQEEKNIGDAKPKEEKSDEKKTEESKEISRESKAEFKKKEEEKINKAVQQDDGVMKVAKSKKGDNETGKRQEASKKTQTHRRPEPKKVDRQTNVDFEEEEKIVESKSVQTRKEENKPPVTVDKSTNVDTLFSNYDYQVPIENKTKSDDSGHSESSNKHVEVVRISPRVKRLKKKKVSAQGTNLTARLKDKIDNIIDIARNSNRADDSCRQSSDDMRYLEMGIPKRVHRRYETKHATSDVELCQDFEEIIIDQRFKIKQNVGGNRDSGKSNPSSLVSEEVPVDNSKSEKKTKVRPVSASSSSNMTVLPNPETEEGKKAEAPPTENQTRFTDQTVQTNESRGKCESIGIQAVDSRKSSLSYDENKTNKGKKKEAEIIKRETDIRMTSSKNIQASGITSSLPKHLEHPKEVNIIQNQNTKSTQFFGGPINSLPNYHSNLITKPNESCSRMPKTIKTTTNSMRENRINSRKNSVVTDVLMFEEKKEMSNKSGCKKDDDGDDSDKKKENTSKNSTEKISNDSSQKENDSGNNTTSNASKKESNSTGKSKKSTEKRKDMYESTEGTEFQSSDDVRSKMLTSEVLKEHGDSVDRSIIQEKYFQSQLIELEKRDMVSRSTSMDKLVEHERNTQTTLSIKKVVTIGCQYSPQRRKKSSKEKKSEKSKTKEEEKVKSKDKKEEKKKLRKELSTDQYDSSQNMIEDEHFGTLGSTNQEQGFGTVDSMPSSTQTAHSWVPGMQDGNQNVNNVVGRARSFEYLPGHIYESSGNLREELPSETDRNLISGSTSGSSESDVSKPSTSDGQKESEGVMDLERNGSSDVRKKGAAESVTKTSEESNKSSEEEKPIKVKKTKKPRDVRGNEISTACQTDKQSISDSERFYLERRELERRIDEEKENHIKCIKSQIEDLNLLLRGLLEKEKQEETKSLNRREKRSQSSKSTIEKHQSADIPKTVFAEVHPHQESPPTHPNPRPAERLKPEEPIALAPLKPQEVRSSIAVEQQLAAEIYGPKPDLMRYGMKVSVTGGPNHLQQVTMMPVGVQVTLKDKKAREECFADDSTYRASHQYNQIPPPYMSSDTSTIDRRPIAPQNKRRQVDMDTQYPSLHREPPTQSISTQVTDSLRNCSKCSQAVCVCLKTVGNPRLLKVPEIELRKPNVKQVKVIDEEEFCRSIELVDVDVSSESCRNDVVDNRTTTQSEVINPSVREKNSNMSQKAKIVGGTSAESSSEKCNCSDFSDACSKCVCKCHEKPLPRCKDCNFLNTCKKCQCYKNIKSCECVKECKKCSRHDDESNNRKCCWNCRLRICLNCEREIFTDDVCKICRCSKVKEQNCAICSCHTDKSAPKPKTKIKESEKFSPHLCKCHHRNLRYFGTCKCDEGNQRKAKEKVSALEQCICPCCEYFNAKIEEFGKNVRKSRDVFLKQFQNSETRSSTDGKSRSEMSSPYEEKIVPETKKMFEKKSSVPEHAPSCPCPRAKGKKDSATIDGHPRHYFLKIEETEDDSIDCYENQKSLEVITVKVPVKKCGKAKKYGEPYEERPGERRKDEQSENNYRDSRPFQELLNRYRSKECTCSRCCQEGSLNQNYQDRNSDWRSDSRPFQDLMNRCRRQDNVRGTNYERSNGYHDRNDEERDYYRSNGRNFERPPTQGYQERDQDRHGPDYFNYNKREYMTKSELEREEKRKNHYLSLQECLETNRPDFYNNAEHRRHVISARAREREQMHNKRVQNLAKLISRTGNEAQYHHGQTRGPKRIFTTSQMKEQTMKRYKHLPEVTNKEADRKKKEEYRTNKLMADMFAKRLQSEALKGHVNLSNSVSVLSSL